MKIFGIFGLTIVSKSNVFPADHKTSVFAYRFRNLSLSI